MKVSLITPWIVDNRMPFFLLLNKYYNITYLITRTSKLHTSSIKGVEKLVYKNFKHHSVWRGLISFSALGHLLFTNYDVVIAHDPHTFESIFGCYITKLKRKKFIIYSETWDWPRHPSCKLLNPFLWLMFKLTDVLIVSSKKAGKYSKKLGYPKNKRYFVVNLPSFDYCSKIDKKELYRRIPETKNKKIILYLNRIVPYKGLDYLVKALSKVDNVYLIVCGTDYPDKKTRNPYFQEEVKQLVKDLGLKNVSFVGYSEEKKRFYLSVVDLVVFPTTMRDYDGESWGYTTVEAMSAKKPVIVTDAVGCAEEVIRNGENGLIVRHSNVEELTKAINRLVSDDNLLRKMGENSRKIWETLTWEKYFNVYKEAIKKCQG